MIEFLLFFEVNIVCIAVLFIIAFNIKTSEFSLGRRPRTLLNLIFFAVGFYVMDIFGRYVRFKFHDPSPALVFALTATYFIFFAMSAYTWFFYSEILHNSTFFHNGKQHVLWGIPLIFIVSLLIFSYFNGWIFNVDKINGYNRGPAFFLQSAISFSYIAVAGIRSLFFALKDPDRENRRELINFSIHSFINLLCGILQFVFGEFPIIIIGNTVSILLVYLHYLRDLISLDALTLISNKRKHLHDGNDAIKLLKPDEDFYFMFVDVDDFKQINDKYGHTEGDRILHEISALLKQFCKANNCRCGRYGGDEFGVWQTVDKNTTFDTPQKIYAMIESSNILIKNKERPTVSIGYSKLEGREKIEDLADRADRNMYDVKRAKKAPR